MTSQELDQHSKIPTTKAKGYILFKRAKDRDKRLYLSFIIPREPNPMFLEK